MSQGNPIHDLERTIASVERLIVGVRPEQWSNSTPCPEWDVHQLVSHMASGNLRFAALVSGRPVTPDASDDPAIAFHLAGAALCDSFAQPGALERSYPISVWRAVRPGAHPPVHRRDAHPRLGPGASHRPAA